eukprot:2295472-Rhodomonas_salina.8
MAQQARRDSGPAHLDRPRLRVRLPSHGLENRTWLHTLRMHSVLPPSSSRLEVSAQRDDRNSAKRVPMNAQDDRGVGGKCAKSVPTDEQDKRGEDTNRTSLGVASQPRTAPITVGSVSAGHRIATQAQSGTIIS